VQGALAALCTLFLFLPADLVGQPKTTIVGGSRIDFGTLHSSMKVKRLVTVRNDGTDTLRVSEVSTSCGCTAALLSRPLIAPGDSGTLSVSFDPRNFTGRVEKAVSMMTNDPADPKPHIIINALVSKLLDVTPEYLVLRSSPGTPATEYLSIANLSAEPIAITSISSPSPMVAFGEIPKSVKAGETVKVAVTVTPQRSGSEKGDIVVTTGHPDVPVIPLRFFTLVTAAAAPADSAK
jgi:hypothetical protein